MSSIKDLLALTYWMDNKNRSKLEALLQDKKKLPREKMQILKDLEQEIGDREIQLMKKQR